MTLLSLPIESIDEACLLGLIGAGVPESRSIEYKRQAYGSTDHAEFLADVSSFANTTGGDIIIGMEAKDGIPLKIIPLAENIESEILRMEQIARSGLQPRLSTISFHTVPLSPKGNAILIRIPRSFSAPHRIVRQNSNRFWARSAAGKYEPDVHELRSLFNAGPHLSERIRDFRFDRVAQIASGSSPVQLMNRGILVLHIIPISALDNRVKLDLNVINQNYKVFAPIGAQFASASRINFEGVLKTSNADQQATQHRACVQLYRNGTIEAITSTLITQNGLIFNLDYLIVRAFIQYLNDLALLGITPPAALLVSLIGVAGARLSFARGHSAWYDEASDPLERDQYHLEMTFTENQPTSHGQCAEMLRNTLDQMANIGGKAVSPIFDNQGNYLPPTL